MKKIFKSLLLTILAVAMMLNTCGIVFAGETAAVRIYEEVVEEEDGIKKLCFAATLPEGATFMVTSVLFSWDNTVIQPVRSTTYADVAMTETSSATVNKRPFAAISTDDYEFSMASPLVKIDGTRTGVLFDTYTEDEAEMEGEFVFTEFYYRALDEEAVTADAFELVVKAKDPEFFGKFYSTNDSQTIMVGDYKYADNRGVADTMILLGDEPEVFDVTVAGATNGVITWDAESLEGLEADTVINFDITPYVGYALSSFKVNDEEMVASVVNGKFALTVAEDATIAATFEEIAVSEEEAANGKIYTAEKIYSVPADATAENEKDRGASQITFGKAVAVEGKVPHTMGVYVEYKDGDNWADLTTKGTGFGPKFGALNPINNQFGIRIFGMDAGTYRVKTYVEYKDALTGEIGAPVYGNPVEFTVE